MQDEGTNVYLEKEREREGERGKVLKGRWKKRETIEEERRGTEGRYRYRYSRYSILLASS